MFGVNGRPRSFWSLGFKDAAVWDGGVRVGNGAERRELASIAKEMIEWMSNEFGPLDTVWFIERKKETLSADGLHRANGPLAPPSRPPYPIMPSTSLVRPVCRFPWSTCAVTLYSACS